MYTSIHFSSSTTYDSITLGLVLYLYKYTKNIDGSYIPLLEGYKGGQEEVKLICFYHIIII